MRLLIAGGGSGGHVFPGLAVVEALRLLAPAVDIHWLGARGEIEGSIVPGAGLPLHTIHAGKLNRFLGKQTLFGLLRVPVGLLEAAAVVRRLRPDAILTCGGFVAVPAGIAGWLGRCPLVALQQDIEPNLANRLISPFARQVVVAFEESRRAFPPGKAVALGNPLRAAIHLGDAEAARRQFSLPPDIPVVLVTGGSQGALSLNRLVIACLPALLERAAVVHLCGVRSEALVRQAAATLPPALAQRYVWRSFVERAMPDLLAAADVVVSRAGAATLAEIAALSKPAILIPLPPAIGKSPQESNAAAFQRCGAAVVLTEKHATPARLLDEVIALLVDWRRRSAIGAAAAALGRPHAAEHVAQLLLQVAGPSARVRRN